MTVDRSSNWARFAPDSIAQVFERAVSVSLRGQDYGDQAVSSLVAFQRLQRLSLNGTDVTPDALRRLRALPRLKMLDLENMAVTDELLTELAQLPALRQISLRRSNVSCTQLSALRSRRPQVELVVSTVAGGKTVETRLAQGTLNVYQCPTSGTAVQ